jgi:methionyl-tRNA synthetase
LGSEERQIVAGIRGHYHPEELVGRQVVVVANLETAKLRGAESQGMVLAASDGDRIVILTPDTKVSPGAKVS